eukprot:6217959-Prorocentrum_lima.AAC.1
MAQRIHVALCSRRPPNPRPHFVLARIADADPVAAGSRAAPGMLVGRRCVGCRGSSGSLLHGRPAGSEPVTVTRISIVALSLLHDRAAGSKPGNVTRISIVALSLLHGRAAGSE